MSFLPVTILAYFFNSIAVLIDKYLLTKSIPNPALYVFNISLLSLLVLVLVPLTHIPSVSAFIFASASTILWICGAYFMFKALKVGQVSRVIPVVGTLIPVILTAISAYSNSISLDEIWSVALLLIGLVFLTSQNLKGAFKKEEILYEVVSALFFADSYVVLKWAYQMQDFLTVFVWSRFILVPLVLLIILIPFFKKAVLSSGDVSQKFKFFSKSGLLFFSGQAVGGISQIFLTFAISLANPALVNALSGTQYVFLFVFSLLLSRVFPKVFSEKVGLVSLTVKFLGIMLVALGLFTLARGQQGEIKVSNLGITYSPKYARTLNLEPMSAFLSLTDSLNFKNLRLPVYWDEVEKLKGKFNFSEVDSYLRVAESKKIKVILVLGYKQPRWPECFSPEWTNGLSRQAKDQVVLELVSKEVEHFKKFNNIIAWQVENEPLFGFGVCEKVDGKTFERIKKEVEIVKKIDQRPVILTDSGELSPWFKTLKLADILGISIYRTVWNPFFGLNDYPLPPFFYRLKNDFVKFIAGKRDQPTIVSELQAEPWIPSKKHITSVSPVEQIKYFSAEKLVKNIEYAQSTKFDLVYIWGVEWWYWMSQKGYPQYLEKAKMLFESN